MPNEIAIAMVAATNPPNATNEIDAEARASNMKLANSRIHEDLELRFCRRRKSVAAMAAEGIGADLRSRPYCCVVDAHEHESEQRGIPLEHVETDASRRGHVVFLGLAVVLTALLLFVAFLTTSVFWIVLCAVLVLLAIAGLVVQLRSASQWDNPQLFWPNGDPLALGQTVTARYRREARRDGMTEGAALKATLSCEERVTQNSDSSNRAVSKHVVYQVPVQVIPYVHPRLVEADLVVSIPVFEAPPTMDLGHNEIHWELEVVAETAGVNQTSHFPVTVSASIAQELTGRH